MHIPYLKKLEDSALLAEVDTILAERSAMSAGEMVAFQLHEQRGYSGTVDITILPGREFDTNWNSKDWTRFPSRIRALATSLLHKRWLGTYHVTCIKGYLTIKCLQRVPSTRNQDWTVEELALAMEFYFRHRTRIPSKSSIKIQQLSTLLQRLNQQNGVIGDHRFRNVNGVYLKLMNFRSQDPEYTAPGKKGMINSNSLEKDLWHRYASDHNALFSYCDYIRAAIVELSESPAVDEVEDFGADEGRLFIRLHRARERNPVLAQKKKKWALKKYGVLQCEICDFDFLRTYGARGGGFIECHHTKPVHAMQPGERTKLQDLALLCANCHRMIHRTPWISVADLKKLLPGYPPCHTPA